MKRAHQRLLLAAALAAQLSLVLPQGFYYPGEDAPPPRIAPRFGSTGSRRPSKVHRGSSSKVYLPGRQPPGSSSRYRGGCDDIPPAPMASVIKCSTFSGCKATCMAGNLFPNGETEIRIRCISGAWTPPEPYLEIPSCAPVCNPQCQNGGVCIGSNICQCPTGFSGQQCQQRQEQCNEPRPTIFNARLRCSDTRCSVTCSRGHETADHRTTFDIKCTEQLGWTAVGDHTDPIPTCQPICRPKCENGGRCVALNLCQCPKQFRGPSCQYSVENCNPKTQLNFNGGYNCSGRGDQFGCRLYCPEGVEFSSPPADVYQCDYSTGEYHPQPVPQCQPEYEVVPPTPPTFVVPTVAPEPRECTLWSGKHVKTFDGQVYSFTGGCGFTAVRDLVTSLFRVAVTRRCDRPDCGWNLRLTVDRTVLLVTSGSDGAVTVTTEQSLYSSAAAVVQLPAELDGLVLEKQGKNNVIIRATSIGITLRYSKDILVVYAESSLWDGVGGLCGTLDGNPYNELLSDGLRATLQHYSDDEACAAGALNTNLRCRGEMQRRARSVCSRAMLRADVFAPCQQPVSVELFKEACEAEYCYSLAQSSTAGGTFTGGYADQSSEDTAVAAVCATVAAFAAECERVTSQPLSWRSEDFCPLSCPAGQVFSRCGVTPSGRCGAAVSDSWVCHEGCACPEGLLMDGEQCVEATECSCQHNGVRYQGGDTVEQDCNTCTCSSGKWLCSERVCPSKCVVAGDPHYLTFDGVRYDFQGKCNYYLVQADDYSVQAENVPCSGAISEKMNYHPSTLSSEPSCTKSVRIEYQGLTVDLKQNLLVLINGEMPPLVPWWVDRLYIKYASTLYISVTLPNGLEVLWDGETRAVIHSPGTLTDNIQGLCGNNNGNQRDDFSTPEGDIETSAIAFASKWKVDETCDDKTRPTSHPCEVHSEKYAEAAQYCDKLISSPAFRACHNVVDPTPYVKNCEYDLCSCRTKLKDCYCVHLADYAEACGARSVPIQWRSEVGICGTSCPFGQEYQVCGDSCSHTCFDLATNTQCERRCVEGCQCPQGLALDADNRCAPISSCPCVHGNKEYRPGHRRYQGKGASLQLCECVNARWDCELSKTEKLTDPTGKCDASKHLLYVDCLPAHPLTCKSRHSTKPETSKSRYEACEPGCVCEDGYVLDASSGECVTADQCPCHHGGKPFAHGASFSTECRTCTCESGMWSCDEQACDGVCTAWGNSHYETFDGRIYDIEGDCQYMLAKGKVSSKMQFEIIVTNVPCGAGSTCPKALQIRVGQGTTLEKVTLEAEKTLPTAFELTRLSVRQAGAFAFVEAPSLGVVVQWDYGTRIYIRLTSEWKGKTQGLCGNFDSNPGDDFRGPSGLLENTAVRFAEQHKLQAYCPSTQPTEDSCKLHPERRLFAVRRCAALKSALFADCHIELNVEPFFERCVQDTCACTGGGDCECLCTAVAAYGQACSRKGVHVHWRSNDLCPMQCDTECSQYSPCVSACPPKTCENRYIYEDITGMCADDTCVEGCQPKPCPPGKVYHNSTLDSCVKENECRTKCAVIDGEQLFEGDVVSKDECHVCYCTRGQMKCRGSSCPVEFDTEEPPTTSEPRNQTERRDMQPCKDGWSGWVNRNKPIVYSRPRDVERIPAFIEPVDNPDTLLAVVDLVPGSSDEVKGRVVFEQKSASEPLIISGDISGLAEGEHGFRIHVEGRTTDQCRDAGGHYSPAQAALGRGGHLGNIVAGDSGLALVKITVPAEKISLFGDRSVIGRTLVVHLGAEGLGLGGGAGSRAPGSAVGRLACGVIKRAYDASTGPGFCADNQVTRVNCRTAGTHLRLAQTGDQVTCTVDRGLVCNSDYTCQDYELQVFCDCSIEATEVPPTEPPRPTKQPADCSEDGWTPWMSGHTPGPGDWTDSEDVRSLRMSHSFCDDGYITSIECRTKLGHQTIGEAGGGAVCNLNAGLVCSDALGYCHDFEVRFYCNCEETFTTKPTRPPTTEEKCAPVGAMFPHSDCHKYLQCSSNGKQVEMSCGTGLMFNTKSNVCDWPAAVAKARPECGKPTDEVLLQCDEQHPVRQHPTDCHAYYQCTRNASGELTEVLQSCGRNMMYNPGTMTCDSVSNVQKIRPECEDGCELNEVHDDCRISCDQLCHYYDKLLVSRGFCQVKGACIPGCRLAGQGYRGCPPGYVWKDDERCVRITECNCRLPNGKPLGPGQLQVEEDGCTRVQCVDNQLLYDSSGCPTIIPTPPPNCDLWGEWIDSTDPTVGDYEAEMLPWWESFCDEGYLKEIECQLTDTGAAYETSGDVGVTCNIKHGLACNNKGQPDGRCHNYRIRYYCSCGVDPNGNTTTPSTIPTTPTVTPTYPTIVPPVDCGVERFIPLLYGEELLPDTSYSASSDAGPEAQPSNARILGQFQDDARSWLPATDDQRQYLQVDLGAPQPVYAVKVQGNTRLRAAVVNFELWISDDGVDFQPLTNDRGLPQGLTSIYPLAGAEPVILPTPVTTRYVRLVPRTWQTRIAVKLEVYGCSEKTVTPSEPTTPVTVSTVLPPPHCNEQQFIPLLHGDKPLPNSHFSATSEVSDVMAAFRAKITGRPDDNARPWIPNNNDQNQYLQVDLGSVQPVYAVTVGGSKPLASSVTEFELLYSLGDGIYSYAVNEMSQPARLVAVEPMSDEPGRIVLPVPVEARYIRIHPVDWTVRIALKLELFGCSEATASPPTTPTPPPRCLEEMGLDNGLLHDSLIKVSSQISDDHGASAVRPGTAGWIPKQSNNKQFITVDLTDERTIDGVVTTGVLVKGSPVPGYPGQRQPDQTRYIGSFRVRYSPDGVTWIWVYNKSGRIKVFPGHSERTALVPMRNIFEHPLNAQFLEIVPDTWSEDGIGATLEVLGCYHPYPEVEVTTTTTPPPVVSPCKLCDGVPETELEGCELCQPGSWWNGTGCISGSGYCPCFYNGRAYEVGAFFDLPDCQECVCQTGTARKCKRKICPPCGGDLVSHLSDKCDCECIPCDDGTRICPTSRTCLEEEKWCDGVKHCPDDEGDECIETTTPAPVTTTTPRPPLLPQYCTLKGNTFNTFDSVEYKYQVCHHTLARQEGLFDVTVHRVCEGTECRRTVNISSLGEEVTLLPGIGVEYQSASRFLYNKQQASAIRSKLGTFKITVIPGGKILFNSPDVGFAVIVNSIGNVVVGVSNNHYGKVEGLCGNFDGNRYNDKHTPDGVLASSTSEFGDSWALSDHEQSCEPETCSHSKEAFAICQKIRREPFSRCHPTVSPDSFISSCLETTCACLDGGKDAEECRCMALTTYVTECLSQDPAVHLQSWRTKHQCPSDCPPGEVYRDCYRPTCEPSCNHLEPCDILPDICFSGCYCPDGQVRKNGECVDPVDCDDCKCGVYPGGDFETFDKEEIIFNTNCTYLAAGREDPSGKYSFKVLVDNGNCHTSYGGGVTCTDDVRVVWGTNVILMKRSGTVRRDSAGKVRSRRAADIGGLRKKISRLDRKIGRLETKGKRVPFKLFARMARYMARLRQLHQKTAPELTTTTAAPALTTTEAPTTPEPPRAAGPAEAAPTALTVERLKTIAGALDRYSRYRPDEPISRAFARAEAVEERDPQMGLRALIRLARRYKDQIDDILNRPVTGYQAEGESRQEAEDGSSARAPAETVSGRRVSRRLPPSAPTTIPSTVQTTARTTARTTAWTTARTTTAFRTAAPVLTTTTGPPRYNSIRNIAMTLRSQAVRTPADLSQSLGVGPRFSRLQQARGGQLSFGVGPRSSRARQRAAAAVRARARTATPPSTATPVLVATSAAAPVMTPPPSGAALGLADRVLVEKARQFSERRPAAQLSQVFRAALDAGSLETFLRQYRSEIASIGSEHAAEEGPDGDDVIEGSLHTERLSVSVPAPEPTGLGRRLTTTPTPEMIAIPEGEDTAPALESLHDLVALPLMAPAPRENLSGGKDDRPQVEVFVNGAMVESFFLKYAWGTVSQPPKGAVLLTVPELHMEVSLHPTSGELSIQLPSKIYGGSVGGVCGNCNNNPEDEAARPPPFWLLDHEDADQCVSEVPDDQCVLPSAELDPCQKMLDETLFGKCHLLEDPMPLVAACQRHLCHDDKHDACDELEHYARRCFEHDLCLSWRSADLCGRDDSCPPTTVYGQCNGTCLKSCEKRDCPRLEMDGCFCPEGQVFEDNRCVDDSICTFCDEEGHYRPGDRWQPDNCTSCLCLPSGSTSCTMADCPRFVTPECGDDEVVTELEGTGTECCSPRYGCKPAPTTTTPEPAPYCPPVVVPACDPAEGKKVQKIIVNGCPMAVCECVPDDECPKAAPLRELKPGESIKERRDTCCPLSEIVCRKESCPAPPECPEDFLLHTPPESVNDCCPPEYCRQPPDTCLVRLDVAIDIRTITAESMEGFVVKRAGEVWTDGFCENCTCREVLGGDPLYQPVCVHIACPTPSAADSEEYVYEENEDSDDICCAEMVRTACRDNGKVYRPGQSWQPTIGGKPVDPCVTWTCETDPKHSVIKVPNREKCVEDCPLGHTYVPAAPGSDQCCGQCERTACVAGGVVRAEGETWKSEDGCTESVCERHYFDNQLSVLSMAALCRDVSDCPKERLYTDETGCCQRCNRTDNCHVKVVPPADTVGLFKHGECVNREPVVGVISCQGNCDSVAFFDTDTSTIQSGCKCCSVTATRQLDLQLSCKAGRTAHHTFTVPDGCACSKCDSSSSELGSSSAGSFWQKSTGEQWTQQTGDDSWTGGAANPWASAGGAANPWGSAGGGDTGLPWLDSGAEADFGGTGRSSSISDGEFFSRLHDAAESDIGTGPIH